MKIPQGQGYTQQNAENIHLRCPSCRRDGTFSPLFNFNDVVFAANARNSAGQLTGHMHRAGMRICPNVQCRQIVFVAIVDNQLAISYPAERLDFDPKGVPEPIVKSFEEAITNHANGCFRSAAIMVRRTLEEICADRGAKGKDLKERLQALQSVIVVPKELLEAADELRILGNDAAHLEARIYDDIGKEEVEAAIDLCKEILKAVYQLSSLVGRLRNLKKPTP